MNWTIDTIIGLVDHLGSNRTEIGQRPLPALLLDLLQRIEMPWRSVLATNS
jgi:hypothetical protein